MSSAEAGLQGGEAPAAGHNHLAAEEIAFWKREGYLIVRSLFDPAEIAELSEQAWRLSQRSDLIDTYNLRCRFRETFDGQGKLWETFDPVIDLCSVCKKMALDPRLTDILRDLYGEPACLFKDKLIFKQPGTKGYELHQDWISWPGFPRSFLTVLLPIDPSTEENGCTEVFGGYHLSGPLTPTDGQYHGLSEDLVDRSRRVPLLLEPGDVAIFDGFTPHCSAANLSDQWRRQLYLSYNARSDGGDQREAHYAEFHQFLKARYPSQEAAKLYFQ